MTQKASRSRSRILTVQEVKARLAPNLNTLASLPRQAVKRYVQNIAPALAKPSPCTRASVIHDLIVEEATKAFGADVFYDAARRRTVWRAAVDLVVQFKKLNDEGLPANYPTAAAQAYETQTVLANFPPGMRVTLGYTLDEAGTSVVEVRIVATDGRRVLMSEELTSNQTVLPIYTAPTAPATAPTERRRLRAKQDVAEEKTQKPGTEKK